jgi:hypothetical protein
MSNPTAKVSPARVSVEVSIVAFAVSSALASFSAAAATPALAPWLVQMGETTAILSAANWGRGQLLGVIDTGIVASNPVFAPGQVSTALSSCDATSFKCANGVADDNGHGTAVASIAAANRVTAGTYSYAGYTVAANSYIGVAPNANIVAEKVLNASGSGYNTDVSNGINKAVAAGVGVINLSLTYMVTPDIVAAINNAAAKGVFIVWAGGNDGKALVANANTNGLTQAAINHLIFAGALDTTAAKAASFSSTAGSGALVSTTGSKTSYASRWISAPGVNILAPGISFGPSAMALWSGTSMSAPLISGSLILLESAWPILKTNGTAANLLLASATDLGSVGIDATYGVGRVNLTTAFNPYGVLSVTQANGKSTPLTSLSGGMISGGALGTLPTVKAKLSSYTALDSYLRNFTVNLSGLILTKPTTASVNPLPSNVNSGVIVMKLNDGGELSGWQAPRANLTDRLGVFGSTAGSNAGSTDSNPGITPVYLALTDRSGTTMAMGYGMSSQRSLAKALYGDSNFSSMANELGTANLSGLAEGGYHLAYGMKVADQTRLAIAMNWSPTNGYGTTGMPEQTAASADAANLTVGLATQLGDAMTGGVSIGHLVERLGVLGTSYDANSQLSLGANRSTSLGLSLGYRIDANNSLLVESGFAVTGASQGNGLLTGTTTIQSRSVGLSFLSRHFLHRDDQLAVSLKQPLRVVSGSVGVITPNIDEAGVAHYSAESVSLVPTGRELDFKLAYDAQLRKNQTLSLQATARKDFTNYAGSQDASVGAIWNSKF